MHCCCGLGKTFVNKNALPSKVHSKALLNSVSGAKGLEE